MVYLISHIDTVNIRVLSLFVARHYVHIVSHYTYIVLVIARIPWLIAAYCCLSLSLILSWSACEMAWLYELGVEIELLHFCTWQRAVTVGEMVVKTC